MYSVYHEMDIEHFIEDMNIKYNSVNRENRLKYIRENRGISQSELSELSGVKLRSIQMYEQKVNSIDKARAGTVYKLFRPFVSLQFVTFKLPSEANIDRLSPGRL